VDPTRPRDDAVAEDSLPLHAEVVDLMDDELVELDEGPAIQEDVEPLARSLLSGLVLPAHALLAAAQLGFRVATTKLFERIVQGHRAFIIVSAMSPLAGTILVLAVVAVAIALVLALVGLWRVAQRAEGVLGILESELRPLMGRVTTLTDDLDLLVRGATREVERLGAVTDQARKVVDGLGRITSALTGATRAGQIVSVAVGLKRGMDVFVDRLRTPSGDVKSGQGDHHGQ
jgi:uncharacterized protein YoxC